MEGCVISKKELKIYRHAMNVTDGKLSITEFSLLILFKVLSVSRLATFFRQLKNPYEQYSDGKNSIENKA